MHALGARWFENQTEAERIIPLKVVNGKRFGEQRYGLAGRSMVESGSLKLRSSKGREEVMVGDSEMLRLWMRGASISRSWEEHPLPTEKTVHLQRALLSNRFRSNASIRGRIDLRLLDFPWIKLVQ